MKKLLSCVTVGLLFVAGSAAAQSCGANTGVAASGEPIKVGSIFSSAAPGDFSSSSDAAAAYFDCVNANGGIHGRPVDYIVENDTWNPEIATQAASKLITDDEVVALVASGSTVDMMVNAGTYVDENVMSMAAACSSAECFETPNAAPVNQGPLPSLVGAAQFMVEEHDTQHIACMSFNVPNMGHWACEAVEGFMSSKGLQATSVYLSPLAPDVNSFILEAVASGADTMLLGMNGPGTIAVLKAAEEQGLRDLFKWVSGAPLYDAATPAALGDHWDGFIYVSTTMAPIDDGGPDNLNWAKVMDAYASEDDPRDSFSQAGYLSARFFVETLQKMDPADLDDRAKVSDAIRGISGLNSDLLCGPYYVGDASFHLPNRAGHMVLLKNGGFEVIRDCFQFESPYFDRHLEAEKKLGLR